VSPVIDRTFPLSEAADAVRYVGTGQARAKVVIKVS
jgi:NADPH:quinone reductase-like Zn-dependent oxidoreductase